MEVLAFPNSSSCFFLIYHHSWVELAKEKMTEQVANEGRPHVDRPQQCEPTFYNINSRPSQFYVLHELYETEEDLMISGCFDLKDL